MEPNTIQQNQAPAGISTMPPIPPEPPKKTNVGALLGSLLVVILLLAGGLFVWGSNVGKEAMLGEVTPTESPTPEPTLNSSSDLDSIETDLNNTNIESSASEDFTFESGN